MKDFYKSEFIFLRLLLEMEHQPRGFLIAFLRRILCRSTTSVVKLQRLHRSFYSRVLFLAIFGIGKSIWGLGSWSSFWGEFDDDLSYLIAGLQDELPSHKDYIDHFVLGLGYIQAVVNTVYDCLDILLYKCCYCHILLFRSNGEIIAR